MVAVLSLGNWGGMCGRRLGLRARACGSWWLACAEAIGALAAWWGGGRDDDGQWYGLGCELVGLGLLV